MLSVVLNIIRNETLIGNREIKCSITYLPTHSFALTDPHVKDKFNLLKILEDSVFLLKYFMVYLFFFASQPFCQRHTFHNNPECHSSPFQYCPTQKVHSLNMHILLKFLIHIKCLEWFQQMKLRIHLRISREDRITNN